MRWARVAVVAALANAGCESCDFTFGPIEVTVVVTPDVPARVTLCAEEQGCQTADTAADTGMSGEAGAAEFFVGWHGYTQCKQPALEILVVAEGCATRSVAVERKRHVELVGPIEVGLDCG
jgi:hypothetical protein